jgi:hypothetical protein
MQAAREGFGFQAPGKAPQRRCLLLSQSRRFSKGEQANHRELQSFATITDLPQ